MPKIEIEVTDEEAAQIAQSSNTYSVQPRIIAEAERIVMRDLDGTKILELLEIIQATSAENKAEALRYVDVLTKVHKVAEDKLAEYGLEYEIYITLGDGRYLDRYGTGYSGRTWMTSSDNC